MAGKKEIYLDHLIQRSRNNVWVKKSTEVRGYNGYINMITIGWILNGLINAWMNEIMDGWTCG